MARRVPLWIAWAISLVVPMAAAQSADARLGGIAVEALDRDGPAALAGMRVRDRLVSWTSCPAEDGTPRSGVFTSPFDFTSVHWNEAPRCPLEVEGWRRGRAVSFVLPDGEWHVRVRPVIPDQIEVYRKGGFRGLATALHAAEQPLDEAWAWLRLGENALEDKHDAEAKAAFAAARAAARAARDPLAEAQVWLAEAAGRRQRDELARTTAAYAEALRLADGADPDGLFAAHLLNKLGNMAAYRGAVESARPLIERSVAIHARLAPESAGMIRSLELLAWVAQDKGDVDAAYEHLGKAAALAAAQGEAGLKNYARAIYLLGKVAAIRGDFATADANFERSLGILESAAPESELVGVVLVSRAELARERGELETAEAHVRRALALFTSRSPSAVAKARGLHMLAGIAESRGDLETAEDSMKQSLALREGIAPDSLDVARTLVGLGRLLSRDGQPAQAETALRRALAIERRQAPRGPAVASCLRGLARLAEERDDAKGARRLLEQALAIDRSAHRTGAASDLAALGELAARSGALRRAEGLCREALAIRRRAGLGGAALAQSWHALALVLSQAGRLSEASTAASRAAAALEKQQASLGGPDDVRSAFSASHARIYKDAIALLVERGRPREAFHLLERSRARGLLELLAGRDIAFVDVPPDLEAERRFVDAAYDRTQSAIGELAPGEQTPRLATLQARLRELRDRRARVEASIRAASPRLAELSHPTPLDLEGARRALDPGTVLLSYCVEPRRTFLFVVTPRGEPGRGLAVFTLPVGEAALRARVVSLRGLIEASAESPDNAADLVQQAAALHGLLVGPAAAEIATARRILVCPDGPLHLLPFAALVISREPLRYLVETAPIHTVVSATLYAALRARRRNAVPSGPITLAAFGDPVTPAERWRPLPSSRDEVHRIAALFAPAAVEYLGADATEQRAKALGSGPRYIHFATHGRLDRRFPLNSALVLSQGSGGRDNGLLQAWEIFESLRLDADLVTLSACESGLGREAGGEGLLSLARAFHYAGARSVLASLWSVPDRSTPELMARFYAALEQGLPKDEALRRAQMDLAHGEQTRHPFHWAAFELSGDWK